MATSTPAIISDVAQTYPDGLRDESRRTGTADGMAFPTSTGEVCVLFRLAAERQRKITIQGSRTGIAAGAVPHGGLVLSLMRMDRILGMTFDAAGSARVRVQPGVTLNALRAVLDGASLDTSDWNIDSREALRCLRSERWMFTPDPTESSASIGGMVACNASGACSFAYGATRSHVCALTVVLADGDLLDLERGKQCASGRRFLVTTRGGRVLTGLVPTYNLPTVKNAAGYYAAPDMDLIDLFIGSEGTLGAIVEIELLLRPRPPITWGVVCFLPNEARALDLVEWVQTSGRAGPTVLPRSGTTASPLLAAVKDDCSARPLPACAASATNGYRVRPVAVEYFDQGVLDLLRQARAAGAHLPQLKAGWNQAVYVEYAVATESAAAACSANLAHWLAAGGDSAEDTWAAIDASGLQRLKEFRHAAPEQVNLRIAERQRQHPGLTKLGTDLSVPDVYLRRVMAMYRRDLAELGLEYVIFGHIGDNHVHVNILPRNMQEYTQGKALYETWAQQVVTWGGSVSAEHGIGKLKINLLQVMYGTDGVAEMRALKRVFDPDGQVNAGNLFAE